VNAILACAFNSPVPTSALGTESCPLRYRCDGSLTVKETMVITFMIDPVEVGIREFEESHLYNKLEETDRRQQDSSGRPLTPPARKSSPT